VYGILVKKIITSPEYVSTTIYDASGNIIEFTEEFIDAE